MDVEVLKSEKKMILERANIEKRELTQEEKDRCHIIDKQVYDIENGFFNPSGFIKTSVKVNITPEKDDVPIPHVELKQEQHDVYVPPTGAKEVMEYDKIHTESEQALAAVQVPPTNVVDPSPAIPESSVVQEVVESTPIVEPIAAAPVNTEPAVESAMPEVAPAEPNVSVTNQAMQTPQETQTNIVIPIKKDFFKKNKGKIILVAIIALLIGFKMNRIISYQYESGGSFGTVKGLYIYKYKYDDLKSISSVFVYEAKENLIESVVEAYEEENCILLELSSTKILVIRKEKSTDDSWYYNNVSKDDTKKACSELNEKDGGKCIAF
jgi:hypothetical protein